MSTTGFEKKLWLDKRLVTARQKPTKAMEVLYLKGFSHKDKTKSVIVKHMTDKH